MVKTVKCHKCTKTIGKKFPGAQCSKCFRWLHCNGTCSSLTPEQLGALSTTDSIDWKCRNCTAGGKPKRLSVILPDPEPAEPIEDEDSETEATEPGGRDKNILLDIHKEIRELRQTVKNIIKQEMQESMKYYSDKIDDYEGRVKDQETKIKLMENKVKHITDSYKNLELKYDALDQKVSKLEQGQISNVIEICGVNEQKDENIQQIVSTMCHLLQQNEEDIVRAHRKKAPIRTGQAQAARAAIDAPISVTLREGCQDMWISASKNTTITSSVFKKANMRITAGGTGHVNTEEQPAGTDDRSVDKKIYARAALTPSVAYLLWKAKSELKPLCKHVWCKDGRIMVRKEDNAKKIYYVHSLKDIQNIKSSMDRAPEG